MATVFEQYDTPMLDYHPDADVQMHGNLDPWFHEEAHMESEDIHLASTRSSDEDLVDVEIEMENYLDEDSQNPEYEMLDEVEAPSYFVVADPEDIVVMDASHQSSVLRDSTLESIALSELPSQSLASSVVESAASPLDPQNNVAAEPKVPSTESHFHSSDFDSVPVNGPSEPEEPITSTVLEEVISPEPLSAYISLEKPSTHAEVSSTEATHVANTITDSAVASNHDDILTKAAVLPAEEAKGSAQTEAEVIHHLPVDEGVVDSTEVEAGTVDQSESVISNVAGSVERPVEHVENEEESRVSELDPHEISEGVYIDPPPAVLLSFAFLDYPDVCLFNQPSQYDPSSSTTEPTSCSVLLSDQPTLYYEPLSTVFEALRNDNELSSIADLSQVELVLDAYDLELTISEDNIFARETSIHDLNVLHDGSNFSGPLRLRLQSVNPRFIIRYRILQEQVMRLNLADADEEYNAEELNESSLQETTEQEHGPDLSEEIVEEYQEQAEETINENHLQSEENTESDSAEVQLDLTNEGDAEHPDELAVSDYDQYPQDTEAAENEEAVEGNTLYDDAQGPEEQDQEDNGEGIVEEPTEPTSLKKLPKDTKKQIASVTVEDELQKKPSRIQEGSPQSQDESHELASENDNEVETFTASEDTLKSHSSESDQGNDLYYDDTADAEWDGSEYEEVIDGDQGADTTIDTEADGEYEYASAQSSITLWSRHSKRSIHDLDEDEIEIDKSKGLVSVQSSPGSKRVAVFPQIIMFAAATSAATSFFARTNISQSYHIGSTPSSLSNAGSRPSTPAPQSSGPSTSTSSASFTPSIYIGLWKVQGATHKITNKKVSVWSFDKRGPEMERLRPSAKERTMEILKAEAAALSRFRHPSILEMVEPPEETRSELIFATEPVISSLELAIPGSGKLASLVELDEVEIQKGILQICKGLSFLHSSAQLIHSHLCPETIMINRAGDWKISGLGLTIPLLQPDGSATRWEFPMFDGRIPTYIQRSFDYTAPEYALDEMLVTASDMYSLGCVIYAVHCKGNPPFKTHGSLSAVRENAARPIAGMERMEPDLQELLRSLITRDHNGRPSPSSLPSDSFFSSLPISTLNFLDLRIHDNLPMLQSKTEKVVFRREVLPLVYNALESDHAVVEKALKMIPDLCDVIDYAELQGVLFPRVALVFTKTRILTVKVATLVTFLAMVKTLDQSSLTQKMVPLLSKIRTKEPAVMMATLSVQEAMGSKVDREAVATLVLPQLWNMSMGPLLNVGQFQRFMEVIRKLGDRVEKEHNQFLRDSQRLEDRSAVAVDGATVTQSFVGSMDFESLVGGKNGAVQTNATGGSVGSAAGKTSWDDDVWGSIFNDTSPSTGPSALAAPLSTTMSPVHSLSSSPKQRPPAQSLKLGGSRPFLPSSNSFSPPTTQRNLGLGFDPTVTSSNTTSPFMAALQPSNTFSSPSQPVPPLSGGPQPQRPNYDILLPSVTPVHNPTLALSTSASPKPAMTPTLMHNSPMSSSLLTPSKPAQPSWKSSNKPTKDDWGDFDPLS
ncbi:kinase-like protein [Lentinula edodes]|uniref:Kinase-like protein n=1 Tax=Lentinula edodes TaxID=5353 RepID=A0A1Q3DYF6_LENED|nr:kinase-like protein [Lentinula edodes]